MKFGKLLRVTSSELEEVEQILSCYKDAKKVLKTWPDSEGEGGASEAAARDNAFVDTLTLHLSRYNVKFEERERGCRAKCVQAEQQACSPICPQTNIPWSTLLHSHGLIQARCLMPYALFMLRPCARASSACGHRSLRLPKLYPPPRCGS